MKLILSQSWRSVFAWREHLYIICVFPVFLMEELYLKWEVSAGCCFSWFTLAAIALKVDGTNIRATRTRAAFKLKLLPGSMMSAIPLEAGARVWGVKNRSLEGVGVFLSVLAVSTLDETWPGLEGMELQFWVGSSSPVVFACAIVVMVSPSWLEMGLGPEGLELPFWAGPAFFLLCVHLQNGNGSLTLSKEQC